MRPLKECDVVKIVLHAQPGANVNDCLIDGLRLAMDEGVSVVVNHNGKQYTVEPKHIFEIVRKTETPGACHD